MTPTSTSAAEMRTAVAQIRTLLEASPSRGILLPLMLPALDHVLADARCRDLIAENAYLTEKLKRSD